MPSEHLAPGEMGTFLNARGSLQFSLKLAGQSEVTLYCPTTDIFTSKTGVSLQAVSNLPQAAVGFVGPPERSTLPGTPLSSKISASKLKVRK
jgi:hypothetical protein